MDLWAWVSVTALFVLLVTRGAEILFRDREKIREVREKLKSMKEVGSYDEEGLREATAVMNKILLRRIVISLIVLLPLWWVVHLGDIETPLGRMGAIWWYVISYLLINGGVWLGSALLKKAKARQG